jgi:peptide/nickel transport system substrate-binding protein
VLAGAADYTMPTDMDGPDAALLARRYGAARRGGPRYFVHPEAQLDFLVLNTHRPLFADARLRRAVNYALDRRALARVAGAFPSLPDHLTDHYLPPGIPGYRDVRVHPAAPDLAAARRLSRGHRGATVVLYYTCPQGGPQCADRAQVVESGLAALRVRVVAREFPPSTYVAKLAHPGEPFDIAFQYWVADYPDPSNFLNLLLESGTQFPTFVDPRARAQLAHAARLTGAERYLTYARLDADLARNAAPFVAYGNASAHELFSARMGCQVYQPVYGMDLAALCLRR